jgi:hypothetical protein
MLFESAEGGRVCIFAREMNDPERKKSSRILSEEKILDQRQKKSKKIEQHQKPLLSKGFLISCNLYKSAPKR